MLPQAEVDDLNVEYKKYIEGLWARWIPENRVRSRDVFEVMRPEEQAKVRRVADLWADYVTPFAEAWWKERGYGVIWPKDNSKPMQVYKL
jgi:hypothetical protein